MHEIIIRHVSKKVLCQHNSQFLIDKNQKKNLEYYAFLVNVLKEYVNTRRSLSQLFDAGFVYSKSN